MGENIMMSGAPSGLKYPDGVGTLVERIGQQGDRMTSDLHGRMWELSSRGQLFFASNQAATTTTIGLATTHTGLCLSNPAGNTFNLEPLMFGFGLTVAAADEATIALAGGYAAAGVVTHTTPLVTYNCKLGNGAAATGKADAAATIVGTPLIIMALEHALKIGELGGRGVFYPEGAICIPPGGYICSYTLTVAVGIFSVIWAELPA